MNSKIITNEEIEDMKISSLPTRPTASKAFGGKGYSSLEMKAAFDALPLFLVEKYNMLIEDIKSGAIAEYIKLDGASVTELIREIKEDIEMLKSRL